MRTVTNLRGLTSALAGGLIAAAAALGFAGSAAAAPSLCNAIAGNLVANCGFETGDFTDWTATRAARGSSFGVNNDNPHSGTYEAAFGAFVPPDEDSISQTIATTAGDTYDISFFLANSHGIMTPNNQFTAMFDGTTLLSLTNAAPFPYTAYNDSVVATGSSTTLSFAAYNVPAIFYLDDISVVPAAAVPEPAALTLFAGALLALGLIRWRRQGKPA